MRKRTRVVGAIPQGASRPASDGVHAAWRQHEQEVQAAISAANQSRFTLVRLMAIADGIDLDAGWVWNADFLRWDRPAGGAPDA